MLFEKIFKKRHMNFNNYTIKSQEVIHKSQSLAQEFGHSQIENEHIFKAIILIDENVIPFLLKKRILTMTLLKKY